MEEGVGGKEGKGKVEDVAEQICPAVKALVTQPFRSHDKNALSLSVRNLISEIIDSF